MFINRTHFYSPDEPAGDIGSTAPADTVPAASAGAESAPAPAPAPAPVPVVSTPRITADFSEIYRANHQSVTAPKADAPADAALGTETAPGTVPDLPVNAPAPAVEDVAPVVDAPDDIIEMPEPVAKMWKDMAATLGVQETDPAKIPAAIEAFRAKQEEQVVAARAEQEKASEEQQIQSLRSEAQKATMDIALVPMQHETLAAMRAEGMTDVDVDQWWEPSTWDLPKAEAEAHVAALQNRYDQLFEQTKARFAGSQEWQKVYENEFLSRHTAATTEKTRLAEALAKYPQHATDLISDFQRAGVRDSATLERIAQATHTHTEKATSMLNSELASTKAALTAAQAQISGHAAALEAARTEGRQAELKLRSQPNPASLGTGSSADTGTGGHFRGGKWIAQ